MYQETANLTSARVSGYDELVTGEHWQQAVEMADTNKENPNLTDPSTGDNPQSPVLHPRALEHALTVVIPTYNEMENLPKMLESLFALDLDELQVLIVDDNSPDGTGGLAERLGREKYNGRVRVLHRAGKLGLGTAYIEGFRYALDNGSAYVVHMDADFSHDPQVIKRFLEMVKEADVAVGSRYTRGGAVDKDWSLFRKLLSRGASVYTRLVLGLKVNDTTAGFKMFRAEALKSLPLESVHCNGYCFHIAVAYLSQQHGLKIAETPIYFRDRTLGKSKMSVQIMIEAAWRVWEIKFKIKR